MQSNLRYFGLVYSAKYILKTYTTRYESKEICIFNRDIDIILILIQLILH